MFHKERVQRRKDLHMNVLNIRISDNHWHPPCNNMGAFTNGGCFLNDSKSKRQVLFSYLHYGGL